jgi:predicted transglutaminase-like cysteine proteinase
VKTLLALALAVALTGCAQIQSLLPNAGAAAKDPQLQLLTLCRAYDETLKALTPLRASGQLSPSAVSTINDVRPTMNATCQNHDISTGALSSLEGNLHKIMTVEQQAKGAKP